MHVRLQIRIEINSKTQAKTTEVKAIRNETKFEACVLNLYFNKNKFIFLLVLHLQKQK
jgi:23S rRNA maturation mini-RNase III